MPAGQGDEEKDQHISASEDLSDEPDSRDGASNAKHLKSSPMQRALLIADDVRVRLAPACMSCRLSRDLEHVLVLIELESTKLKPYGAGVLG